MQCSSRFLFVKLVVVYETRLRHEIKNVFKIEEFVIFFEIASGGGPGVPLGRILGGFGEHFGVILDVFGTFQGSFGL